MANLQPLPTPDPVRALANYLGELDKALATLNEQRNRLFGVDVADATWADAEVMRCRMERLRAVVELGGGA